MTYPEENPEFSSPVEDGNGARPDGWATLAFVALIMVATGFASDMWGQLAYYAKCSVILPHIPEIFYLIDYYYGYLLGALAGGLLGWRYGFRLPLVAVLVWQGFILIGSQIFDMSHWICPLRGLFGLSAGIVFPVCFQALTACTRAEQRPLPLFFLVFLMPHLNVHVSGYGRFYLPESPDSISYALTGAFLMALAVIAWSRNPQWLRPTSSPRIGPGAESAHLNCNAWGRLLQIDSVSKRVIVAGLCVFAVSDAFPFFIYKYYQANFYSSMLALDAFTPLVNSLTIGTTMLILGAVYVQFKGPESAWSLLIGIFLAQVALFPLAGILEASSLWSQIIGLGLGLCGVLAVYCCYLLLLNRLDPAQAGLVAAIMLLLSHLIRYSMINILMSDDGPPIGLWGLVFFSWLALAGALLTARAKVLAIGEGGAGSGPVD